MKKQFDLPISKKYKLTITKLPPGVMVRNKYYSYPMLPTHLMGMEFVDQDGDIATVNLTIGQEDGEWYEAQPCPTELGMERFAKLVQMRAQRHARAEAEMAQVKDPVRSAARADKQARYRRRMAAVHELAQDRLFNLQGNGLDNVGRQERRVKQRENGHEDRTSSAADWRRD